MHCHVPTTPSLARCAARRRRVDGGLAAGLGLLRIRPCTRRTPVDQLRATSQHHPGNGRRWHGRVRRHRRAAPSATTGRQRGAPTAGDAISINNFAFVPATLTVPPGATVTWTNQDQEPHTVVANDGSFHSPGLGTGATYSYTFPTVGSFDYICSIHPFMHGTVVVTK